MKCLAALLLVSFGSAAALSAEVKVPADVDMAALARQLQAIGEGDGVNAALWWPPEFWAIASGKTADMPPEFRRQMLADIGGISFLGVLQGERRPDNSMSYLDRSSLEKGMTIEWVDASGVLRLQPLAEIPAELREFLKEQDLSMRSLYGEMGRHIHIFAVQRETAKKPLSAHETGRLLVRLTGRDGKPMEPLVIEAPIDALFVPRLCSNGKPTHVSWKFCPWDGSRLRD